MDTLEFFARNPVFTRDEFSALRNGTRSPLTSRNLLAHHAAAGRLVRVRRGLYATVPRGVEPRAARVDPYLLASKLAPDAIVAYHAALQFHGKAHSVWNRFTYLTLRRLRPFRFRDAEFVAVRCPARLRGLPDLGGGILDLPHAGGSVRVSTLERTLVDVLDAPQHGGGWEEIWRSLESVEFFDLDAVVDYALKLGSFLTAARVGFYLDQHRDALMVEDRHLDPLRERVPAQPAYLDRKREPGRLVRPWNLVVPEHVLARSWGAIA
jgi:predicted transcriptional regulator of viral defense system